MRLHDLSAPLILAAFTALPQANAARWDVTSPNGTVVLSVGLSKPSDRLTHPRRPRLYYHVEHGAPGSRSTVITESPLGLLLKEDDLLDGLRLVSVGTPTRVEETYTMI